jgi:limonene 1,2-monooxygenase
LRGETVTAENDWLSLHEARLQLAPYSDPHMEVAVTASFSPTGPGIAGKYGIGLLSIASFLPGGLAGLAKTWQLAEEAAAEHGQSVDRKNWRVVIPIHLAETREEAVNDVRDGCQFFADSYIRDVMSPEIGARAGIEDLIANDGAIIGTPDDAIEMIERMLEASGGFGGIVDRQKEWATPTKTGRSYELLARYVMPHFQRQNVRQRANYEWVRENRTTFGINTAPPPAAAPRASTQPAGRQ